MHVRFVTMHLLIVGHQIAGRHLLELTEEDLEKMEVL